MKNLNDGPLDGEAVATIFRAIMDESRRIQEMYAGDAGAKAKEPTTRRPSIKIGRQP